jgi:hypothetical protein
VEVIPSIIGIELASSEMRDLIQALKEEDS